MDHPDQEISNSSPPWAAGLTRKQRVFVEEYLVDLNGTQAAIRAGYAANSAAQVAYRLLRNAQIAAAVDAALAERPGVTRARIVEELAAIAFANPRHVMEWDAAGVRLRPSTELTDEQARGVAEVSQTKGGVRVKLADKLAALQTLGRALGMFTDRVQHEHGATDEVGELLRLIDGKSRGVPPVR